MRAMALMQFGGPAVLQLAAIERPLAQPGHVVVQVAYAGVNPADWKAREGWLASYFSARFPLVIGFDGSGVVAEVGVGVTDFEVGDRVVVATNFGLGENGAYAEYVAANHERIVKLAPNVSLRDAAALPTAGMTAWEAVFDVGGATADTRILVNGGAGGTGSFAIQLGKMAGAHVAATCGPSNLNYVRSLGADLVIDYHEGQVLETVRAWAPDGVDLVIDTVGQGTLLNAMEIAKRGGIVAPIATLIADEATPCEARAAELGVRVIPTMSTFANHGRQLRALADALAAGKIRVPELSVHPLASAAEAHRLVEAGHVRGKLLLHVSDEMGQ